jgi:hypothetical protein
MRIPSGPAWTLLVLSLAAARPAAALGRNLSFDEVVTQGRTVLVGTVLSESTRWGEGRKMIWTDYRVAVDEAWKGSPGAVVVLSFAGGAVDGQSILVTHVPRLAVGTTYFFSLHDLSRLYTSPVVGADQGLLREATDLATGSRVFVDEGGSVIGLGSDGTLARVAFAVPGAAANTVTLLRPAPSLGRGPGARGARGIPGAVYSDGTGKPLEAPSRPPALAPAAASGGVATGGLPATRDSLRSAVQRALDRHDAGR